MCPTHRERLTLDGMIDAEALRAKYRAERDKRLRADGSDQYVEPVGQFAQYLDDPYVAPTPASRCSTTSRWPSSVADSPGWSPVPV